MNVQKNLYTKKYRMNYILNENSDILDTFNLLMNLDDEDTNFSIKVPNNIKSIHFENITFKYPNTCSPTLANASFTFEAGCKYAIVCENGCGKTTIFKLLLGRKFVACG